MNRLNNKGLISRRSFVQQAAFCLAAAQLPFGCQSGSVNHDDGILKRRVERCDISLPVVGLGTGVTFQVGESREDRSPILVVLGEFFKKGGVLLDTSTSYGSAEVVIGDLAKELEIGEQLFYATKVSTHGNASDLGAVQFKESQGKLKRECIDLLQVHELRDYKEHLVMISRLKAEGLVRFSGLTVALASQFEELYKIMKMRDDIDFIQINYSLLTRGAEERILPLAMDRGMGVLVNRPFEGSQLFTRVSNAKLPEWVADFDCSSWSQFFLKFIISHPAVTCPLPATKKLSHLIENMQSGYGSLPDPQQRQKMVTYFETLS